MTDSEAGAGDSREEAGADSPDARTDSTDARAESPDVPNAPGGTTESGGTEVPGRTDDPGATTDDPAGTTDESTATTASQPPSDAFGALGNEVRMGVVRELAAADREGDAGRTFSELFEASDVDTTAGFAYHLRQLAGHYVTKADDAYRLTYAGRKIARAIAGGTYTESVTRTPIRVEDPCPFCAAEALELRSADNYTSVACPTCERVLLTLPFPPSGHRSHDAEDLPLAFDRHHRHRIALMADGICPECGATVDRAVERPPEELSEQLPDGAGERVRLALSCDACGHRVRCPVTLSVLAHPEVVSFYRDHGEDVRERPLWNVGAEWRESVVSDDPWCVLVSTRLDDEVLDLYLDAKATVVATRRTGVE